MTSYNAGGSAHPEGPAPVPAAPPPQGMFEQLIFLNAGYFPVDGLTYWLHETGGVYEYSVIPPSPPVLPNESHIDTHNAARRFAIAIEAQIDFAGHVYVMQPYAVQEPGFHIQRVWMGLAAATGSFDPRPYCHLALRSNADPALVALEIVPPMLWV